MYAATGNAATGNTTTLRQWGYRHPRITAAIRIAAGMWNLVLGVSLVSQGHPWGVVMLAISSVLFCAAYFFYRRASESQRNGQR